MTKEVLANTVIYTRNIVYYFTSSGRKSGNEFLFRFKENGIDETLHLSPRKVIETRQSDRGGQAIGQPRTSSISLKRSRPDNVAPLGHNGLVLHHAGTICATGCLWAHLPTNLAVPPGKVRYFLSSRLSGSRYRTIRLSPMIPSQTLMEKRRWYACG